jgi:hypothetical protein
MIRILKVLVGAAVLLLMPLSGYASASASAKPSADLSVSMTASPQPVVVNWNVTYRIVVRNNGPSEATNVKLLDEYGSDAYYSWAGASVGFCVHKVGGEVSCSLGTLSRGGVAYVTVVLTNGGGGGTGNTVTVSSSTADPKKGNNSVSMTVKTISGPPPPTGGPSHTPTPSVRPSRSPRPTATATVTPTETGSPSATPEASPALASSSNAVIWILVGVAALAAGGVGGFLLWRRRR